MADYDPEHQGDAWDENEEYEDSDGDQQEDSQDSSDQDQAEYSLDQPSHASGDLLPSADGATDDVGDYDPASVTSAAAPELAPPVLENNRALHIASPQPAQKPRKTAGGFLVGDSDSDSDSEDDGEPVAASSGLAAGPASQSSVPRSPAPSSTAVPDFAGVPSNPHPPPQVTAAVTAPPNRLGNGSVAAPSASADAPSTGHQAAAAAAPDRIAALESRVRDDPRGAMDAWLALIKEYRSRNDVEASRQVYDRFLQIFPQAVSLYLFVLADKSTEIEMLTCVRLMSGPPIWRWNWA